MKIIYEYPYKYLTHAWDGEIEREKGGRFLSLCGASVYDNGADDTTTEVTCGMCLRLLAARRLDNKLEPLAVQSSLGC